MSTHAELLLYGVFRRLIERHLPLGVADYLDALRALRVQISDPGLHRPAGREGLRRLCQILWARNAEEARLIDMVFGTIPQPTADDIQALTDLVPRLSRGEQEGAGAPPDPRGAGVAPGEPGAESQTVRIEIAPASGTGGVPLPYPVLPAVIAETFVMAPQTVVSARTLAVLWRRYRRMARAGTATELDLDATIAERCRIGTIARPVLRAPRVNRARLLILADVSPSMAAWRPFLGALAGSLSLSRLQHARILYFTNIPKRSFFQSPALSGATSAKKVFEAFKGAGLLIVSDAGAARGYMSAQRAGQTTAFLGAANQHTRAVVWLNPMPRPRWTGTTAEAIATARTATFLPLDVPSLIRSVDILRGAKSH